MAITAVVIPADRQVPLRKEQLEPADADAYRRLVGGYLQVVNLDRPPASMYVNEEGKLTEGLSVNRRATALLWVHNSAFRDADYIVGDAFLVGVPDAEGNDTSVPAELVKLLFETESYGIEVQVHGEESWHGNQKRFTDWFNAYMWVLGLADRWTLVREVRVVPAP